MNLKQTTFSAVRWTSFAMVGNTLLQLAQIAILARLLTPSDFGLIAMVMAIMAFVQVLSDLGVSNAIIHYQDITQSQLSSLYWLNVCVGFGLMLTIMILSYPISTLLFKQPDLQPLLMLLSFTVLLTAAGQQLRVMAEKALRFSVLAKIELTCVLFGFFTAIGWALVSPSVYALLAGTMVSEAIKSLLLWCFATQGWRPTCRLKLGEIQHFLKFGAYIMANNFINSVNMQADVLIAGRLFPAVSVGLYSAPRNLSLKIAGAINPVVSRVGLPLMAQAQHDKTFLKTVYLKTMRMTASINFPIYLALGVFSNEIITLVLGPRWHDSAQLLTLLAIWGMFRSCGNPVGSLLLAVGKADVSFKWNLCLFFIVPPFLWVAAQWGIEGLAAGQAILMATLLIPAWYFLVWPNCGAHGWEYAKSLLSPLICSLPAVSLGFLAATLVTEPGYRLLVAGIIATPIYLLLSAAFNREWLLAMWQLLAFRN